MKIIFLIPALLFLSIGMHAESLTQIYLHFDQLDKDTFNSGSFGMINGADTLALDMKIRHRGATSTLYDKPSYAIKLIDTLGNKLEKKLLGMRKSNYWILDAMATDHARMRNRVSMDLWLEMSRRPWYADQESKVINGYRGQMVEVYVDSISRGIYHLMERIDRKQLCLQKYTDTTGVQGLLYKSIKYNYFTNYYPTIRPTNTSGEWYGWEQKEPDWEDNEPICFGPLYRHMKACTVNDATVCDSIHMHLDVLVYVDYILFSQLLSARDNTSKNQYLSRYRADNVRFMITPWDLDHSWGRMFDGTMEDSRAEVNYNDHRLYQAFINQCHGADTLAARYAELRKRYFTVEHIDSLFAVYFDLFSQTGMDTIEHKIWSGHNGIYFSIAGEQQYIHDWVIERLEYLDSMYQYTVPEPSVPTALTDHHTTPQKIMRNHTFYILRGDNVYDIMGRKKEDE